MILQVANIPDEGMEMDFTQKDGWVREKLTRALKELHHESDPVKGHFSVYKTVNNLAIRGDAHLPIHATCARCLKDYDYEIDVHFDRLLVPLFESTREREIHRDEEAELTKDDLDFSYFEGDEIDVGDILAEHVVLEQPMIYLCQPECKGLCPQCGANRNEKECACSQKDIRESPFSALKGFVKK
ncbi:MAG: DUF177 domain-containing protein [bacterium]